MFTGTKLTRIIFFFLIQTRLAHLGPNDSPVWYSNNNQMWNLCMKTVLHLGFASCADLAQQAFVAVWIWQIVSDENTCTCAPSCYTTHAHNHTRTSV